MKTKKRRRSFSCNKIYSRRIFNKRSTPWVTMWKMSKRLIRIRNRKSLCWWGPKLRRRKRICISRCLKSKKGSKILLRKDQGRIRGKNLLTLRSHHLLEQKKSNLPLLNNIIQTSRWIPSKPEIQKKNTLTCESINKMCQWISYFNLKHRNSSTNVKKNRCKTLVIQQLSKENKPK